MSVTKAAQVMVVEKPISKMTVLLELLDPISRATITIYGMEGTNPSNPGQLTELAPNTFFFQEKESGGYFTFLVGNYSLRQASNSVHLETLKFGEGYCTILRTRSITEVILNDCSLEGDSKNFRIFIYLGKVLELQDDKSCAPSVVFLDTNTMFFN